MITNMSIYVGEFLPKVLEISTRLEAAKARLVALPRPSLLDTAKGLLPWETNRDITNQQLADRIAAAEAEVRQLQGLLAVAERHTIQHLIDLLECVPQDRDNFMIVRESLIYARALAKIEEQSV